MTPEPAQSHSHWSDLEFRRRARQRDSRGDGGWGAGALVVIVAVLLFPWYQWWVHAYLDQRAMAHALAELERQTQRDLAALQREQSAQAERSAALSLDARLASVRIVGTGTASGMKLAIVDFGSSDLGEARDRVCVLAARHFREDMSGQALRIQASRGLRPAREAGVIRCR